MLAFLTFLFLVVNQSAGSDDLSKLLKKYPTWSFEAKSVEALIQDAIPSFRTLVPNLSEATLRAKISAKLGPNATHVVRKVGDPRWLKKLPATFDARDKWPKCAELIGDVPDEGACHSDGPAMIASAASDRYCIFTNETFKERLSQEMLAGCAEFCTKTPIPYLSFQYIKQHGIPTGGGYKSNEGCVPYLLPPCKHDRASYLQNFESVINAGNKMKSCSEEMAYDHNCPTKCYNSKYSKPLDEDRKKFTAWFFLNHEFTMRNEIFTYGPVIANIFLYSDFLKYPEGIYWKNKDAEMLLYMKHIKLIGWGKENGTKYWLAVNSWDHWGPTKVFKIPRGIDYLWVEWDAMAGVYEDDDIDRPSH